MDALAEKLDSKLREWKPETADQIRQRVAEVIDLPITTFSTCCARGRPNRKCSSPASQTPAHF